MPYKILLEQGFPVNRLSREASLYLRQHAHNPVDWHPWGEEALKEAQRRELPLFISIGYSSCHWCHVMERESFMDPEIASFLNRHFIPIKVDREEHPEVDALYMQACLLIHGHGGWPLNVFAFPDGKPFFAGTYFPPRSRSGQIGFEDILRRIVELWNTRKEELLKDAESLVAALNSIGSRLNKQTSLSQPSISPPLSELTRITLLRFDPIFGGTIGSPKFPPHELLHTWFFLLTQGERSPRIRNAIKLTLDRILSSALRDTLGGGFHRYCVDEAWRIPHFEKMLYDQAAFLHHLSRSYQHFRDPWILQCLRELLGELLSEWKTSTGLYASAFSADDPQGEGAYYTFTRSEILSEFGKEEGEKVLLWFQIEDPGPVEGRSTLYPLGRPDDPTRTLVISHELPFSTWYAQTCARLRRMRDQRQKPQRDDKGIVVQNAYLLLGFNETLRTPLAAEILPETLALAHKLKEVAAMDPIPRVLYEDRVHGEARFGEYAFLGLSLLYTGLNLEEPEFLSQSHFLLREAIRRFYSAGQWLTTPPELPWGSPPGYWDGELPSLMAILLHYLSAMALLFPGEYDSIRDELASTLLPLSAEHPEYTLGIQRSLGLSRDKLKVLILYSQPPPGILSLLPDSVLLITPRVLSWLEKMGSKLFLGKPSAGSNPCLCSATYCEPPIPLENLPSFLKERFFPEKEPE